MSAIPNDLLRVSNAKLGNHKGHSRLYMQGKYLTDAGFKPAEKIRMIISHECIELVIDESGTTTISKKVKNDEMIPVIDILSDSLKEELGDDLEIRVSNRSIILKPSRMARSKRQRESSENTYTCGSIFAGIGLLSQAAKESGYTERFAIEIEPKYVDIYEENFPESKIINQSVHEVNADDIPDVDLLLCGIPCQPFSRARRNGKDYEKGSVPESHELGDMVFWTLRIIDILISRNSNDKNSPKLKAIIIEEAPDFIKSGAGQILIHALRRMKFFVHSEIYDSNEYGCIQSRNRSVIVATTGTYVPPKKSECIETISDIIEKGINHDWFNRDSKKWLYDHWDRQTEKGNNFANGLIITDCKNTNSVRAIKKRYFAQQGDNPVIASEDKMSHRWFTLTEVKRLFNLPDDYKLNSSSKTIIGEGLGQGVVIGLFTQIIKSINLKNNFLIPEKTDDDEKLIQPYLFVI